MSQKRQAKIVEKSQFSERNDSEELLKAVHSHNEAMKGKGLKFLRSFLSNVVRNPHYEAAKPLLDQVNSGSVAGSLAIAKALLSQKYDSAEQTFRMRQIASIVKKYPFEGNDEARRAAAISKFKRGERRNTLLNLLMRRRRVLTKGDHPDCDYSHLNDSFTHDMRQFIRRVIGDEPDMSRLLEGARWGPGSTVGVNGKFTNYARKLLANSWTITPAAIPYALHIFKRLPVFWEVLGLTHQYDGRLPVICLDSDEFERRFMAKIVRVQHNKIAFVLKDATEDRTIASEPTLNQLLQLAVDFEMKLCLKRVGLNLHNQDINKIRARNGSVLSAHDPDSTIDLTNASGSIYIEIVRELFPRGWFVLLNALRSPEYRCHEMGQKRYSAFASMGNGFCFPVETLIFASICHAAHVKMGTPSDFVVYGDDIIVRQHVTPTVLEKLRYYGFEVNASKSYTNGPFRESCGADWYDGKPVRPVYIKTSLDTFEERVRVHNAFARSHTDADFLSSCCVAWFPRFASKFVRPWADNTDEAIDNRFGHHVRHHVWDTTFRVPAWYGLRFRAKPDREVERRNGFPIALLYGALSGASSSLPFAARRETRMAVIRFSHGGGGSLWLPHPHTARVMRPAVVTPSDSLPDCVMT